MKYTFEQKLAAVKRHIETGDYLYPKGCKSRGARHSYAGQVRFWHSVYLRKGEEGLRHNVFNASYSPEQKLEIITPILVGAVSLSARSRELSIQSGTLSAWVRKYRENGLDGLKCSKRGRPRKNMPENTEEKKDTATDDKRRIKDLEHQNLLLRAELEYLKNCKPWSSGRESQSFKKGGNRPLARPRRRIQRKADAQGASADVRTGEVVIRICGEISGKAGKSR